MKLLLDEMYPEALAEALREHGIDAVSVAALGLISRSDFDVFEVAIAAERAVLTENVSDFARLAADRLVAGSGHNGVIIALSTRFSRRPQGREAIMKALDAIKGESLQNLTVYLTPIA